ncbi:MAG: DUF4920 domain-containing protein [Ferruginibacter sp.]|nr:DUF4920 domain-containing protein [Ferruginibacter sp.]
MKKLFFLITVLVLTFSVMAQPPEGPADKGMSFGEKTTVEGSISADELVTLLAAKPKTAVKVKGKVLEVCKAEGCWIKMQTSNGPMMIKMKDHSFMVPLAMNGKIIVAQGTANFKETSVEMLRHYAEDAGQTKEEIAAIKKPKKEMTMQATGILVL